MLSIMVHGNGRMGKAIVDELQNNAEFVCLGNIEKIGKIPECDLVIDVSSPQGTTALLPRLDHQKLLIGTTGDLPMPEIKTYARDIAVAMTSNFAPGMQIVKQVLAQMKLSVFTDFGIDYDIRIEGVHHKNKKNPPSGTSRALAEIIQTATGKNPEIKSTLQGETAGEHSIIISNKDEIIELTHIVHSQKAMAQGALNIARWLSHQKPGLYKL